ncbi:MAG: hypothetical protein EA362_00115 [Saprospirales bacterium]|nr:MAG: hypothetical protein EA362_00115 [Saprospirales bacterium]
MERTIFIVTNKGAELPAHVFFILRFKLGVKRIIRVNSDEDRGGFCFRFGGDEASLYFESGDKRIALKSTDVFEKASFFYYQGSLPFSNHYQELEYFTSISKAVDISLRKFISKYSHRAIIAFPESLNFKLSNLLLAQSLGLKIPETEVFNAYKVGGKKISPINKISKAITNIYRVRTEEKLQEGPGTFRIKKLPKRAQYFTPSLLQKEVVKDFEIRSVYLLGIFYSMAIFSQNDEQTKLDYRNYNRTKPNRNVPFSLPKSIETKLESIAKELGLKFCSFDLIRNKQGNYVFIEVNPEGQIGWVSRNCNYNIELKIAKYLAS